MFRHSAGQAGIYRLTALTTIFSFFGLKSDLTLNGYKDEEIVQAEKIYLENGAGIQPVLQGKRDPDPSQ